MEHSRDSIDKEVAAELKCSPGTTWATTREGALAQLNNFIENRLQYQNIGDNEADDFIGHYDEVKGGFETFTLPDEFRAGFEGVAERIDAATGNKWRYESAPWFFG
ncbi:MAG: hypothetical protein EBT12_03345 [Marivivens sp.]|nr:hypothetical protein [Marivivens sp.]